MKKRFYNFISLGATGLLLWCNFACNQGRKPDPQAGKAPVPPSSITQTDSTKPVVNVYIENSGSMDGYVKGVTEFKSMVYNYLSDIKIAEVADSLNLYYINSKIFPQGTVSEEMDVLKDFIEKLNPTTFKNKGSVGGSRNTTDMADIVKSVMQQTGENTISLLVTDGIFSPGKTVRDVDGWLVNQQIGIKNATAAFLKKEKNAAVIIYQLSSKFDGIYYNKADAKIPFTGERPFYVWVIGSAKNLVALNRAVPASKFNGQGLQNVFSIATGNQSIHYAIVPSSGKFRLSRNDPQKTIEDLKKDSRTGKVKFAVNADFSTLLLDEHYLLDAGNYENNSKYELEIKPNVTKNNRYTHTLNFRSDKVYPKGTVSVKLKSNYPDWVEKVNDNNGSTALNGKTYGIKYQIDGVFEVFTNKDKYYTELKINIE